ncbi:MULTISPECIES: class I adenylate-forming enzyme family protein [Xenorhabdus]|uniref:class I adenylate-forming enzyme family protein n=1 Tax=Xenorhabdus TaxID=626 RepID=UPI0006487E72|nr:MULTISPECIES: class I adenylate-forming enzyme family protein [Xenorhabdus]
MTTIMTDEQRKSLQLNPTLGAGNFLPIAQAFYSANDEASIIIPEGTQIAAEEHVYQLTIQQLYQLALRWARWYQARGVKPFDVVGVYCGDGINYILHYAALNALGAVPALTNGAMPIATAGAHFSNIGACLVVSAGKQGSVLKNHLKKRIEVVMIEKVSLASELLKEADFYQHEADSPIMITHSSGTTGTPKAVILAHQQWFHGIRDLLNKPQAQGNDYYLNALPSSHNSSIAFLIHCALSGSKIVMACSREGQNVAELIEKWHPSTVVAFPQTYVELATNYAERCDFSSVNTWINSGDAAHEPHIRRLVRQGWHYRGKVRVEGSQFVDGLGSSEMGHISIRIIHTPYTNNYGRCVGLPQEWVQVRIFRADGSEAIAGEVGCLGIKSPSITPGYWNNSALTYQSRIKGYWLTGDLAYQDENGLVFHVDRISDVVMTSGGPCYSLLSEEIILSNFAELEDCSIVGESFDSKFAQPVLFAVVQPQAEVIDEEALLQRINQCLTDRKLVELSQLVLLQHRDIPKGITGKVLKRQLRDEMRRMPLLAKLRQHTSAN